MTRFHFSFSREIILLIKEGLPVMAAAESEVPAGCSSAGSGGSPASNKIDEWRRFFRDRGLSAGDIPKALVVHEVLRRHPFLTAAPGSARRALLARGQAH